MNDLTNISCTKEQYDVAESAAFIMITESLIEEYGADMAVLFCYLKNKGRYWEKKKKKNNGWFFHSGKELKKKTKWGKDKQRKILNQLEKAGLIEIEFRGMPKRKWFRVNTENYIKTIHKLETTQWAVTTSSGGRKRRPNTNNINTKNKVSTYVDTNVSDKSDTSTLSTKGKVKYRESSKRTKAVPRRENKLITYWNNLPGVARHTKRDTDTYKISSKLLYHVERGTIFREHPKLHEWVKSLNSNKTMDQPISKDRIKSLLSKAAKSYIAKTGNKPRLDTLIYNKRSKSGFSFFYFALSGGKFTNVMKDPHPKITARFWEILNSDDITDADQNKLIRGVEAMKSWHQRMVLDRIEKEKIHYTDVMEIFSFVDLCKIYIQWLDEVRYQNFQIRPYMIGPKATGKNWGEFLRFLDEAYDIRIKRFRKGE